MRPFRMWMEQTTPTTAQSTSRSSRGWCALLQSVCERTRRNKACIACYGTAMRSRLLSPRPCSFSTGQPNAPGNSTSRCNAIELPGNSIPRSKSDHENNPQVLLDSISRKAIDANRFSCSLFPSRIPFASGCGKVPGSISVPERLREEESAHLSEQLLCGTDSVKAYGPQREIALLVSFFIMI